MKPGELIRFYRNGWHVGELVSIDTKKKTAKIQPLRYKTKPRHVTVPIEDVEELSK